MDELEMAQINIRRLENELRAAQKSLWDQFFMAALKACVIEWGGAGVAEAALIADEALRVRNERAGKAV
ncbi:MAG: hypothetical protein KGZ68_12720 [Dechloromonas sp.]|nr:hypothetical protein [Dechloromonas sp.]